MKNDFQLERYKKLLSFIEDNFKEEINIEKVEEICHYSYRNINRIFEAIHHETIGKFVKRLRLEKAAQYLKYSEMGVSDIAYEVGFVDRAAFSKAFKKKYGISPNTFRSESEIQFETAQNTIIIEEGNDRKPLQFELEYLPDFEYLFLEYRGDYENFLAMEATGNQLHRYAMEKQILNHNSVFMTEIIDDSEISDDIHLRYNMAFTLDRPLQFQPEGHFRARRHKRQKYAKFIHEGTSQECYDFYAKIYTFWMLDVGLELVDKPTLEFYPDLSDDKSQKVMRTEIYIPVN